MRWTPYIYLRLVFFLILGVIFQEIIQIKAFYGLYSLIVLGVIYALLDFGLVKSQRIRFNFVLGMLGCAIVFVFGWLRTMRHDMSQSPENILYRQGIEAYTAQLSSEAQPKEKSIRFEGTLNRVRIKGQWQKINGKVILYFRKDSLPTPGLEYGDLLLIRGAPALVEAPKNPASFDYRSYLKYQNIFHQHFVGKADYRRISQLKSFNLFLISYKIRSYLTAHLQRYISDPQSLGIASALLLGVKSHLDSEILSAYAGSGLMHILSVSGLHIAFVVLLLNVLLSRLKKSRLGSYVYLFLVITALWLYAFLTGLSPSVLRAATMFSFVLVGQILRKRSPIYNTLGASAFILIAWNPYLVYSVSFQLSYVAVLGIVYLQPRFYRLLAFEYWLWDYLWSMTCVSMAAQIATFPLGLYYFHQFPNYFLISNLVVLPFFQLIFYIGIALLFTPVFHWLSQWLGWALNGMIQLTNLITLTLYELPYSVLEGIQIGGLELWLIYGCLISLLLLFEFRRLSYLIAATVCMVLISFFQVQRIYQQKHQEFLIIYDTPKSSNFNLVNGQKSIFFADSSLISNQKAIGFHVKPFWDSVGIRQRDFLLMDSVSYHQAFFTYKNEGVYGLLFWKQHKILILQKKLSLNQLKSLSQIKPDYILIQRKAIRKISVLTEVIPAKTYILDASNGFFLGKKLAAEADSLGISCHLTSQKGAFMLRH